MPTQPRPQPTPEAAQPPAARRAAARRLVAAALTALAPFAAVAPLATLSPLAAAQVQAVDPVWMTLTEPVAVRAGALEDYYRVASLNPGDVVRVTGRYGEWRRIELPRTADLFVRALEVGTPADGQVSLVAPSRLKLIGVDTDLADKPDAWWVNALAEPMPSGTKLDVIRPAGPAGLVVRLPRGTAFAAQAFVPAKSLRLATPGEVAAHTGTPAPAATASNTPAPVTPTPSPDQATPSAAGSTPGVGSAPSAVPSPVPSPVLDESQGTLTPTVTPPTTPVADAIDPATQPTAAPTGQPASVPAVDGALLAQLERDILAPFGFKLPPSLRQVADAAAPVASQTPVTAPDPAGTSVTANPGLVPVEPTTIAQGGVPAPLPTLSAQGYRDLVEAARAGGTERFEASIPELIAEGRRASAATTNEGQRKWIEGVIAWLEVRQEASTTRQELSAALDEAAVRERELATLAARGLGRERFDVVGRLLASPVYDGQRLPRLFRVESVDDARLTLGYIVPQDNVDYRPMLGRVVGVRGANRLDAELKVRIITPTALKAIEAASTGSGG